MTTDSQPIADTIEATEPVEAKRRTPSLTSKPIALAAGVGVVALLAGGGAGFGLAQIGDSSTATSSNSALALPATLSGGFKRNTTVDTQIKAAVASARTTLGAGTDMALYASGNSQVLVEATRIGGGATLSAGMTYARVGDAICSSSTSSRGSAAICTRTGGALTIKVTASDQATAAKYVDEVYKSFA